MVIVLSLVFWICATAFRHARGVPFGKWVANIMDDLNTREDATLSRRRLFEGIWRHVERVVFALLFRAINNLIRESWVDFHIPNLGHGVLGRAEQPPIKVTLHRLAALGKILHRPDLAVGETFVDRDWDVAEEDLARLLMALL